MSASHEASGRKGCGRLAALLVGFAILAGTCAPAGAQQPPPQPPPPEKLVGKPQGRDMSRPPPPPAMRMQGPQGGQQGGGQGVAGQGGNNHERFRASVNSNVDQHAQ